jgi:hypothetical protein
VHVPNGAFKKAMAQAALDLPGATKAQIGRLVSITKPTVSLYGIPYLYMDIVRLAGINRVPDIRTRAAFPHWACEVTVGFISKLIRHTDVYNLFAAAGVLCGIGDGRTERGSRDNGQWIVVGKHDKEFKEWKAIVAGGGRAKQIAAMERAEPLDEDSAELLTFYRAEMIKREQMPEEEVEDFEDVEAEDDADGGAEAEAEDDDDVEVPLPPSITVATSKRGRGRPLASARNGNGRKAEAVDAPPVPSAPAIEATSKRRRNGRKHKGESK